MNTSSMDKGKILIYFDEIADSSWIPHSVGKTILEKLKETSLVKRIKVLDYENIKKELEETISINPKKTTLLFLNDVIPASIFEEKVEDFTLLRFLQKGGTIVWIGDVPFFYRTNKEKQKVDAWRDLQPIKILGVFPLSKVSHEQNMCKLIWLKYKYKIKNPWPSFRPVLIMRTSRNKTFAAIKPAISSPTLYFNNPEINNTFIKEFYKARSWKITGIKLGSPALSIDLKNDGVVNSDSKSNFVFHTKMSSGWTRCIGGPKIYGTFIRIWDFPFEKFLPKNSTTPELSLEQMLPDLVRLLEITVK